VVPVNPSTLRLKAVRINVTIPERTLDAIDTYAVAHGQTRSGLLAEAAMTYIGRDSTKPERKTGPKTRTT
jgi:metal-responsive CopG/Arc/MetJ family transcriptional regulator